MSDFFFWSPDPIDLRIFFPWQDETDWVVGISDEPLRIEIINLTPRGPVEIPVTFLDLCVL